MKTKEELNALKAEYEFLNRKLGELTDDSGGYQIDEKTREMIRQGIDPYQ